MLRHIVFIVTMVLNNALGAQWMVVFEDNFNGSKLNKKYWYNYRPWGNNDEFVYIDSGNVKVENGYLYLALKHDFTHYPPYTFTGAYVWSKIRFTYGIVEAKIMLPDVYNCWSAFWLYGSSLYKDEIDIFEQYWNSNKVDLAVTIHHSGQELCDHNKYDRSFINNKWHIYTLMWDNVAESNAKIKVHIDGNKVSEFRKITNNKLHKPWETKKINYPTNSQSIIFDIVTHEGYQNYTTNYMIIDYIKVWQKQDCESNVNLCNYNPRYDNNVYTGKNIQNGNNCQITINEDEFLHLFATKEIHLKPGFSVKKGENFVGKILSCSMNKNGPFTSDSSIFTSQKFVTINDDNQKVNYYVYPNPCSQYVMLKIDLQDPGKYIVDIYDIYGNCLLTKVLDKNINIIDLSNLNSGIYFLKLI